MYAEAEVVDFYSGLILLKVRNKDLPCLKLAEEDPEVGEEVLTPNLGTWTGDHCMDHTLVPGILLANRPLLADDPDLKDMCTPILNFYGIPKHPQMLGRVVLSP